MKKFVKVMALMLVVVMSVALLASCGVSEKTAEKINQAAKDGEAMTVEEVKKLCGGDPTVGVDIVLAGEMIWISGCKNLEDAQKKYEDGKTLKALFVTFVLGKATFADYKDWTHSK